MRSGTGSSGSRSDLEDPNQIEALYDTLGNEKENLIVRDVDIKQKLGTHHYQQRGTRSGRLTGESPRVQVRIDQSILG